MKIQISPEDLNLSEIMKMDLQLKEGTPGTADAKVEIKTTNSSIPSALYYTLIPKGPTDVRKMKYLEI